MRTGPKIEAVEPPDIDNSANFSNLLLTDLRVESAVSRLISLGATKGVLAPGGDRPVLHFVLEGLVWFRMATEGKGVELRAGDCVLVFYGDPHVLMSPAATDVTEVAFQGPPDLVDEIPAIEIGEGRPQSRLLSSVLELGYFSPSAKINRAAPDFSIMRTRERQIDDGEYLTFDPGQLSACCEGAGGVAFATMFASLQYVSFCRRSVKQLWESTRPQNRDPNARRIASALRKINAHLDRPWTVGSLAKEVGLSRSLFSEKFVDCVGVAPHTYLTNTRMQRAAQLLLGSAITCREVARRVGYPLESSFSRTFKRHYGVAPTLFVERKVRERH